jgi:hypothetical protein
MAGLAFNGPVSILALQQPSMGDEPSLADPVTGGVRGVSLAGADCEGLVHSEVNLAECRFAGMHRMDQLIFGGQCTFTRDPHGRPAGAGLGKLLAGHPRITPGQAAWGAGGCPHQPVRRWSGLRAPR